MPVEEARSKAEEWGVQYVETSAKTRANVDKVGELFVFLGNTLEKRHDLSITSVCSFMETRGGLILPDVHLIMMRGSGRI